MTDAAADWRAHGSPVWPRRVRRTSPISPRGRRLLKRLGIVSPPRPGRAVIEEPVPIATKGAQWGSLHVPGMLCDGVLLSDDAGPFAVAPASPRWIDC